MPIESLNTDMLIVVMGTLSILLTMAYLDRCLARRRRLASNAEYLARIQAARVNSELHQYGRSYRANGPFEGTRFDDLICEPAIELSAHGFFSRRRSISDQFGRLVATHYEEFVMADRLPDRDIPMLARPQLRLASGNA